MMENLRKSWSLISPAFPNKAEALIKVLSVTEGTLGARWGERENNPFIIIITFIIAFGAFLFAEVKWSRRFRQKIRNIGK